MVYYTRIFTPNHRETQQRGKRKQNHWIWGVETNRFEVIFKKFQKISRFFEIGDLPFYLAPLPDIFERKDPGFVRFTGRSDDPENLSKKY